jgi:hypothetical protein
MSSSGDRSDVVGPPGPGPTQEELIEDAQAARENVADAVPVDDPDDTVVSRIRDGAARTAGAVRDGGDRAFEKLPAPVADKARPVWTVLSRRPLVLLGGLATAVGGLVTWLRIRRR